MLHIASSMLCEYHVIAVEKLFPKASVLFFLSCHIRCAVAKVRKVCDSPSLAVSSVGIAMGAMGSDAAIEASDIVLMDDDPMKIVKAIKISRKCLRIVRQNIGFAITVKILALVLVALGVANMWLAIFADVGVMILAVLNAIRALFVKKL